MCAEARVRIEDNPPEEGANVWLCSPRLGVKRVYYLKRDSLWSSKQYWYSIDRGPYVRVTHWQLVVPPAPPEE